MRGASCRERRERRERTAVAALVSLSALLVSSGDARAQLGVSTGTGNNLNIEHYSPAPLGFSTTNTSRSQQWREYSAGIFLHYVRNPLVLFQDRLQIGEVVGHRVSM